MLQVWIIFILEVRVKVSEDINALSRILTSIYLIGWTDRPEHCNYIWHSCALFKPILKSQCIASWMVLSGKHFQMFWKFSKLNIFASYCSFHCDSYSRISRILLETFCFTSILNYMLHCGCVLALKEIRKKGEHLLNSNSNTVT